MTSENAAAAATETVRDNATAADSAVEARARRMGWRTEEDWDDSSMERKPKKFLSADEYIDKVESDLPILRERNRFLDKTVSKLETQLDATATQLRTNNDKVTELGKLVESLHEQNKEGVKRGYEAAKRQLEEAKRRAVSEADEETYDEAQRRLVELERHKPDDTPKPKAEDAKPKADERPVPKLSRVAQDWVDGNQDIMNDPIMNPVAVSLHTRNMAGGLNEAESLAKLQGQIREEFPHKFANARREQPSTVASTTPGGGKSTKKQTFDGLPSEAKTTFERLQKFMGSKGKTYTKEQYTQDYYHELEAGRS